MCISPVTILNPTKYVSVHFRDRFLLQVPCGLCSECQSAKSNEYLFRSYVEFCQCFENQGFVYFDTLTYDEEHLPRLNQIQEDFPAVPCFNPRHITLFFKDLRIKLQRKYNVSLRYFLSSEYGSKFGRPHYHILLYIYGKLDALELSSLVSQTWKYGRTDGFPYKSSLYVRHHNVVDGGNVGDLLRTSNYVSKYVQKNCSFQKMLDSRMRKCEQILDCDVVNGKLRLQGVAISRLREKLKKSVNQFHLQSLHYGENALRDLDINQIFRDGYLVMPHFKAVKMPFAVPTYYKRKLFYDLITIHGSKCWQINELGIQYRKHRLVFNQKMLASRLSCAAQLAGLSCDADALADYVLNHRGRYRDAETESTLIDRLDVLTHYPYLTRSDKENVGVGISLSFIGNSSLGYKPLTNKLKIGDFISQYVYLDQEKEKQLTILYDAMQPLNLGKQRAFVLEQRLTELFKNL